MTLIFGPILSLLLFACDTEGVPPDVVSEDRTSLGTFTALLNGERYTAPASYSADSLGWFYLGATSVDSSLAPPYVQEVLFASFEEGFRQGQTWNLSEQALLAFVSESIADGVLQQHNPLADAPGELRVVEADSSAGRLRVAFHGTFVAIAPSSNQYVRLPDTLRFSEGEFVIDLESDAKGG